MSRLEDFLSRLLGGPNVYIRVGRNRVVFQDCTTGEELEIPATMEVAERPDGMAFVASVGNAPRQEVPPDAVIRRVTPFDHPRLLLADFDAAEQFLRHGIRQILRAKWFRPSPMICIHPVGKIDGGVAPLEERAFRDIALLAGARKVVFNEGAQLAPQQVNRLLEEGQQSSAGTERKWSR